MIPTEIFVYISSLIPIIVVSTLILIVFRRGQIKCKKCGWYNDYEIFKPRHCRNCGVKM